MNSFQSPYVQYFLVPFLVYPNIDKNLVFPQHDHSMVKMEHNDPLSGTNMNTLNTIPSNSFMNIPESSSQEYSQGRWTKKEVRLYAEFTERWERENNFPDSWERKKRFYFNAMSSFIGTRSSEQCKSHDQKARRKRLNKKAPSFEKLEEIIKKEEDQTE